MFLCFACGGCASPGQATPSFAAMPGRGKSYEAFQRDDQYCQSSAQQAIGYQSPGQAANQEAVGTAAVGTALGAIAGAAIGSVSGNMERVRRWALAPVWLQVVLLEQGMPMPPAAPCK